VKLAVSLALPVSVAMTFTEPGTEFGTLNIAVQLPLAPTDGLAGEVITVVPPNVTLLTDAAAAYPVPVAVTDVPLAPVVGVSAKSARTAKLVAELAACDAASVTETGCEPFDVGGIVKVTVADEPLALVVLPEVIEAVFPPTLTVNAEFAAKP
jgi:hypothetical protein